MTALDPSISANPMALGAGGGQGVDGAGLAQESLAGGDPADGEQFLSIISIRQSYLTANPQ
jgi:hypothetical protein